jgi:hypothetical protein
MRADLVALGIRLDWVSADAEEVSAVDTAMERLRNEGEGILLIFDNAVDADALKHSLPRGSADTRSRQLRLFTRAIFYEPKLDPFITTRYLFSIPTSIQPITISGTAFALGRGAALPPVRSSCGLARAGPPKSWRSIPAASAPNIPIACMRRCSCFDKWRAERRFGHPRLCQ